MRHKFLKDFGQLKIGIIDLFNHNRLKTLGQGNKKPNRTELVSKLHLCCNSLEFFLMPEQELLSVT